MAGTAFATVVGGGGLIEVADFASLPASGEANTIYRTLDDNRLWAWDSASSEWDEQSPSPASSDAVPEGASNQYFTAARARGVSLTGLSTSDAGDISALDSIIIALGKVQAKWNSFAASVRGVALTGIDVVTKGVVAAGDSVLQAIGKLQASKADVLDVVTLGDGDFTQTTNVANDTIYLTSAHYGRLVKLNTSGTKFLIHQSDVNSGLSRDDDALICWNLNANSVTVQGGGGRGGTVVARDATAAFVLPQKVLVTALRTSANTLSQVDRRKATLAEAQAGTDVEAYVTPSLVAAAVAALGGATSVGKSGTAVNDVGSGSTAETVVTSWVIPALGAHSLVELLFLINGTGTANKAYKIRAGGTGTDGTILWQASTPSAVLKWLVSFHNRGATDSNLSQSDVLTAYGQTTVDHRATTVQTNAGLTMYLTVVKTTGTDVVNCQFKHARVWQ